MVSTRLWIHSILAVGALASPLLAKGGTGRFQVTHMARDPAWTVEFDAPKDKEAVKAGQGDLPADRKVAIPFRQAVLFTFDRSQCSASTGTIRFALVDAGGARAQFQADDKGNVAFADAASAKAAEGVVKLVLAKDSMTGITTLSLSGDALKR
jgi:hypothetical protein